MIVHGLKVKRKKKLIVKKYAMMRTNSHLKKQAVWALGWQARRRWGSHPPGTATSALALLQPRLGGNVTSVASSSPRASSLFS